MKKILFFIITITFATLCSGQSTRPMVTNLESVLSTDNTGVILTWSISEEATSQIDELLVFRNKGTIIRTSNLANLNPIATIPESTLSYVDNIEDFNSYYYAVVGRTTNGKIFDVIIPTVNATNIAIVRQKEHATITEVKSSEVNIYADTSPSIQKNIKSPMRERPLPYIGILAGNEKKDVPLLSDEAILATRPSVKDYEQAVFFYPLVLEKDKNGDYATGDDYTLHLIVSTVFLEENWERSKQELHKYLQINRAQDATARAHFYLAQVYYFQKNYRESLSFFQKSQRLYPAESKKWIEETLNQLTIS